MPPRNRIELSHPVARDDGDHAAATPPRSVRVMPWLLASALAVGIVFASWQAMRLRHEPQPQDLAGEQKPLTELTVSVASLTGPNAPAITWDQLFDALGLEAEPRRLTLQQNRVGGVTPESRAPISTSDVTLVLEGASDGARPER